MSKKYEKLAEKLLDKAILETDDPKIIGSPDDIWVSQQPYERPPLIKHAKDYAKKIGLNVSDDKIGQIIDQRPKEIKRIKVYSWIETELDELKNPSS